ncbi:barstar family protein [Murinocardiopsis flavida]|uniref:barstar family protein n=1 Tax=Murinocardiopsis flavida TaxID=645275 RepID=UPI0014728070|nr:barstar family protein [Murinocardiopsis flavida]
MLEGIENPPYFLDYRDRDKHVSALNNSGFQVVNIDADEIQSERDASFLVARALGYPDFFGGGWDALFDLLTTEFQDRPRILAVGLLDSHKLASRNLRLFVNISWNLLNATDTVNYEGEGEWQLEFFYWGNWDEYS